MPLRFSPSSGAAVVISSSSRGPTGAAATIAVGTVTTGAAGSSAAVTNSGTTAAAVFNFTIPRGNTGNATGPGVSVNGNLASWNGTGGVTLADSGVAAASVYRSGGTDVAVADGGTGSSTAAGAATNLGLGTGDSPQFTAVNIGNATDTTITRTGAGDIAVEGNAVYRAGGTDVAVADGGTGSSTAATARTALGLAIGTDVQAFDAQLSSLVPQNSKSAAYTTVLTDSGKHIYHPSSDNNARTFTIDSNANVAYSIGTVLTFVNEINTVTIAITTDTLTLAGSGSTGSRTLAANGLATALKVAATKWVISGTGLT